MGFLKDIIKGFTMSTEEVIAESNNEISKYYKETEGLNYIKLIYSRAVWGIEQEYGEISNVLLFEDRLRFNSGIKRHNRDLLFKNIVGIEVLTDIQIEQKSKVGQMLVIGMFALATKPRTEEILKRKLVINASEDNIGFAIVIDTTDDALVVAKSLNKFIK